MPLGVDMVPMQGHLAGVSTWGKVWDAVSSVLAWRMAKSTPFHTTGSLALAYRVSYDATSF